MKRALDNGHIMCKYSYPKNMEESLKLMDDHKVVSGRTRYMMNRESMGVGFLQNGKI